MNVNIYYGGRGLIGDPTLYVIDKMQEVLEELHVNVTRYNLYENKNSIVTLPQTLKDAEGIILASTVEWYGIGGYMQQFLDSCWLYGDKEIISKIYMCPIVMSTTYGEREGKLTLATAWEILGGRPCSGICGYIADTLMLEMNEDYTTIIEKKAENLYRTIKQKVSSFPASNQAVKQIISTTPNTDLTPQETEQLSEYASDDGYVQRQKEDIQELANLFRDMMSENPEESKEHYIAALQKVFQPDRELKATYLLKLENKKLTMFIKVDGSRLNISYENVTEADVEMSLDTNVFEEILAGRMTFQRAFMSGVMKMKGNFKALRSLDQIFVFGEN
ncbi:MAG: SCP2 sterol-binding domain-containing protein [Lachnospiraceae bacterium]|nr:SCP2 sterol-binding domain-containing protein [Lachnospiraceae bacterium]